MRIDKWTLVYPLSSIKPGVYSQSVFRFRAIHKRVFMFSWKANRQTIFGRIWHFRFNVQTINNQTTNWKLEICFTGWWSLLWRCPHDPAAVPAINQNVPMRLLSSMMTFRFVSFLSRCLIKGSLRNQCLNFSDSRSGDRENLIYVMNWWQLLIAYGRVSLTSLTQLRFNKVLMRQILMRKLRNELGMNDKLWNFSLKTERRTFLSSLIEFSGEFWNFLHSSSGIFYEQKQAENKNWK